MTFNQLFSEGKKTFLLGVPIVIGQLAQMSMGFVDTVMAGNLSPEDLAAVAIGSSFLHPIFVFSIGLFMALNPIVSHHLGSRKLEEIGPAVRHALYLSVIMAGISFFLLRNMAWAMRLMDLEPEVIHLAQGYLESISWGVFPITTFLVLRFFNEGLSVTKPTMYIAFLGLPFNILGNWVFMYGKFGFPAMGAVGTGWASSLVAVVMFIALVIFTASQKSYRRFNLLSGIRKPELRYIKEQLRIGIPNGLSSFMEVSMFAFVALLMGSLGTTVVAGHQIAINIGSIIFMIPMGLSVAITTRVGFAYGRKNLEAVKRAGFGGILLCVSIMFFTAGILITLPEFLVGIYTSDKEVISIAVQLLFLAAIFQLSDGFQVSGAGALRGLKDTTIPMIVNFISYWLVGIPLGYGLGIYLEIGPNGLWIGLIAGLTVAAILHNSRFVYLTKRLSFS